MIKKESCVSSTPKTPDKSPNCRKRSSDLAPLIKQTDYDVEKAFAEIGGFGRF